MMLSCPIARHRSVLATGVAWLLLVLLPEAVLFARGEIPFGSDTVASNFPLKWLAIDGWSRGVYPTWTSRLGTGYPLAADTISLPLDPRNLLFALLPRIYAYWAMLLIPPIVGGWVMLGYLHLRHQADLMAALAATSVYFLGTLFYDESRLHSTGVILAWLPAVIWLAERLHDNITWGRFHSLAIVYALMFVTGSVAYLVYIPPFIICWLFVRPSWSRSSLSQVTWRQTVPLQIASFTVGLLLAAIMIIPFLELVSESNRGAEYPTDPYAFRSLFFMTFGPRPTGPIVPDHHTFFYVGVIGLAAASNAVSTANYVRTAVAAGIILVVLAILMSPLKPLLVSIFPLLATFSFYRLSFYWGWTIAVLVARSLSTTAVDEWATNRTCLVPRFLWGLHLGLLALGIALRIWIAVAPWEMELPQVSREVLHPLVGTGLLVITLVRVAGLSAILHHKGEYTQGLLRLTKHRFVAAMLILEMAVTWSVLRRGEPWRDASYPVTTNVETLRRELGFHYRMATLLSTDPHQSADRCTTLWLDAPAVHGLATASLYESLVPRRLSQLYDGFNDFPLRSRLFARATNAVMASTCKETSRLYDLLAVAHLVPVGSTNGHDHGRCRLVHRPTPLPRAFVAYDAHPLRHDDYLAWYRQLAESDTALAIDPWATVVIDEDEYQTVVKTKERKSRPIDNATVIEDSGSSVVVEVDAHTDGFLVLLDLWYPGWRASVDGERTPILKANGFARAVPVSAGRHQVEFHYEPGSLRIGATLSALTAGFIVVVSLWSHCRQKLRNEAKFYSGHKLADMR